MAITYSSSTGKHNAIKDNTALKDFGYTTISGSQVLTSITFYGIAKHGTTATDTVTCTGTNGTDFTGSGSEGSVTISNFGTGPNSYASGSITYVHSSGSTGRGYHGGSGSHSDTGTFSGTYG